MTMDGMDLTFDFNSMHFHSEEPAVVGRASSNDGGDEGDSRISSRDQVAVGGNETTGTSGRD